jgi:hypothetical protein
MTTFNATKEDANIFFCFLFFVSLFVCHQGEENGDEML